MADLENLSRPDYWKRVSDCVERCIKAELVDLHFEDRKGFDPAEGRDVFSTFAALWRRDCTRGWRGSESWGTHSGCVRYGKDPETGEPGYYAHIYGGAYDLDEEAARDDFTTRQLTLG